MDKVFFFNSAITTEILEVAMKFVIKANYGDIFNKFSDVVDNKVTKCILSYDALTIFNFVLGSLKLPCP